MTIHVLVLQGNFQFKPHARFLIKVSQIVPFGCGCACLVWKWQGSFAGVCRFGVVGSGSSNSFLSQIQHGSHCWHCLHAFAWEWSCAKASLVWIDAHVMWKLCMKFKKAWLFTKGKTARKELIITCTNLRFNIIFY